MQTITLDQLAQMGQYQQEMMNQIQQTYAAQQPFQNMGYEQDYGVNQDVQYAEPGEYYGQTEGEYVEGEGDYG